MFWKGAKRRVRRFRFSISARLTLLYTVTSFIAVTMFTGVLYWMLTRNFNSEHIRFLRSKAAELAEDFMDGGNRPQDLLAEIAKETSGTDLSEYHARVLNPRGKILGETPGMNTSLPQASFPAVVTIGSINQAATTDRFLGQRHLVLAAFTLGSTDATGPGYTVQIALDVTRDDALLADYRRGLLLFLILLLPILLVAGHAVTRRGLQPLQRISRAARGVTPARLTERIPLDPPWPSELIELVQVFNSMMVRLDEAFGRLSRFSADLAHELRTPLNNLMGEMEVCLSRDRDAGEYRRTVTSNFEECRRLTTLIENLLFIARAEEADQAIGLAPFDTRSMCEGVLASYAVSAAERGVRLTCTGESTLCADPMLFRQALGNLLANAIRHSPTGGTVSVSIDSSKQAQVEIRVSDEGRGIAPEHLPHVFDRFYQADASRSPRGQGTGLGLSIVRSIMDLHAGTVSMENEAGKGAIVRLQFPAQAP